MGEGRADGGLAFQRQRESVWVGVRVFVGVGVREWIRQITGRRTTDIQNKEWVEILWNQ